MARGTIGPSILLVVLEIPLLVTYFSGVDPTNMWPNQAAQVSPTQGGALIVFLAFLSFVVGYLAREPRKAIQIFALSQAMAFSLSIIPLFIYPRTSEGLALVQCFPNCGEYGGNQLVSSLYLFFVGFAFVVVLIGFVMAGFGSLVAERRKEKVQDEE
jgi:hypothetical protein